MEGREVLSDETTGGEGAAKQYIRGRSATRRFVSSD